MTIKSCLLTLLTTLTLSLWCFSSAAEDANIQIITDSIYQLDPNLVPTSIKPSPIPGIYQVLFGAEVFYASEDGQYIIQGELLDIKNKENISETEKSKVRADTLKHLPDSDVISFMPEKTENTIYVFTDISCAYCRKLHQDVPELNENGVAIKYLAYPRTGVNSSAAFELAAVWCSEDRNRALTDAKAGLSVDAPECDHPIAEQYELGLSFGIKGTPAIFLENGHMVPGYYPPERLIKIIKESS